MKIIPNEIYHIYNQGNNRQQIFKNENDYFRFLKLFRLYVNPYCSVLAYCLMPNHFHFLIATNDNSVKTKQLGTVESSELANGFRFLQSRYARFFNKTYNQSGSLFRQKTKAKSISDGNAGYDSTILTYIHQNPWEAGLVKKIEDWPFSSYIEYQSKSLNGLCDLSLAKKLLDYNWNDFEKESYSKLRQEWISEYF